MLVPVFGNIANHIHLPGSANQERVFHSACAAAILAASVRLRHITIYRELNFVNPGPVVAFRYGRVLRIHPHKLPHADLHGKRHL